MSTDDTSKLFTPRRTTPIQALSGLFRTPTRFRTPTTASRRIKRSRTEASSSSPTPSAPSTPSLPAVVLQTYSVSTDSIVLTALSSVPFCCHEDLLTMTRAQLEAVVRALNAKLPRRMRIGPGDDFWNDIGEYGDNDDDGLSRMSEAEMKRRVEELVGIRPVVGKNRVSKLGMGLGARTGVPPAPKAVRTRNATWKPYEKTPWEMEVDGAGDLSDDSSIIIEDALIGSSPLASRTNFGSHVHSLHNTYPRLAVLQEESEVGDDNSEDDEPRPFKRQCVASESATHSSEGEAEIVQDVRKSRLLENMDLSGSPLLAKDDDQDITDCDGRAYTTQSSKEAVPVLPTRRRSTRIKELTLKRASVVDTGNKLITDVRGLKSILLYSKPSPARSSRDILPTLGVLDTGRDFATPKELTIRLPFTSSSPHQKTDSSIWSAPRLLRSHSQRLPNSGQPAKAITPLGRSQSERYPRSADLAFVTIKRPRYHFSRRSKGIKTANGDQALYSSTSALPLQEVSKPPQGVHISTEYLHGKHKHEGDKENDYPEVAAMSSTVANLSAVPSVLCNILVPRSTAPSTSTIASAQGYSNESLARTMGKEDITVTTVTDSVASDGTAEHVWKALGRMAVDSL